MMSFALSGIGSFVSKRTSPDKAELPRVFVREALCWDNKSKVSPFLSL